MQSERTCTSSNMICWGLLVEGGCEANAHLSLSNYKYKWRVMVHICMYE